MLTEKFKINKICISISEQRQNTSKAAGISLWTKRETSVAANREQCQTGMFFK